jgi:hypothetical protein
MFVRLTVNAYGFIAFLVHMQFTARIHYYDDPMVVLSPS